MVQGGSSVNKVFGTLFTTFSLNSFNPFTAPACKISGLKIALIRACKQYIRCSYNKSTFNAAHFDKVLSRAHAKEEKSLSDFKFGTFIGHFQSDGTSSMAVQRVN